MVAAAHQNLKVVAGIQILQTAVIPNQKSKFIEVEQNDSPSQEKI